MRLSAELRRSFRLPIFSSTLIGAVVFGILFALAWATSALADAPASRTFLGLFTQQALKSPHGEFATGLAGAIGLGALVGAVVALGFNLVASGLRR